MEIKLEQVSKQYGKKMVFENLNETFASGKITGLVGDNGAGKSTLLRLIAGLDLDYSGHIYYDGQPLTKPLYQQMTMVFQTPYLLKRSVYDNIAYPLQLRHRAYHTVSYPCKGQFPFSHGNFSDKSKSVRWHNRPATPYC